MLARWDSLSLIRQFLLAGVAISLLAMLLVGAVVADITARSFIKNAGTSTALFVDSVIAPILPDLQTAQQLDDVVTRSLDESLGAGRLGERLVSFRLWSKDGVILYSNRADLVGKTFQPSASLRAAFSGEIVAEFDDADDAESDFERSLAVPLLEVYSPVLQPWSGEVVGVLEFYEKVPDFAQSLHLARLKAWGAVAMVTLGLFGSLAAIVLRGSYMIDAQREALKARIDELADLAARNKALVERVQVAAENAANFNERFLQRLGADLHDGPAQQVAFAALRLGSRSLRKNPKTGSDDELALIKDSLQDALDEIRVISGALALPHIETADLREVLKAAVVAHEKRTDDKVTLRMSGKAPPLNGPAKICLFRFVQEALNNASRHADGAGLSVIQGISGKMLRIEVADRGVGFNVNEVSRDRFGLACLRQRVEAVGGQFELESTSKGTRVSMSLHLKESGEDRKWAA
jgi:signal transduction histidine kinase